MAQWQTHRFRDCVAVYTGTGPTVYLCAKEARRLARAINRAAASVEREPFTQAPPLTVTGACIEPDAENCRLPTMARDETGKGKHYTKD